MSQIVEGGSLLALVELIRRAGQEILEIYNRRDADWDVSLKEDRTPVTEADRISNSIITDGLRQLFPDIPLISEENRQVPYEMRQNYEYCWLLDPLDGTREFLSRNGEFTINLALIHSGQPVAGFISVPCKGLFYYAVREEGAYRVQLDIAGEARKTGDEKGQTEAYEDRTKTALNQKVRLRVAEFSMDEPGLAVVASRSHFDEATRKFIEGLNQPRLTNRGSSLKFMMLAEGQAHLYPRLGRTMEWDTAAGQAILEEAGGQVLKFYSRSRLTYNKKSLENPPFLATGRVINSES
ncbi:MAG: 3'(2'),5'-bisphosphate nucleotidase CysQ [Candidatus Saccharicenans sp.]|nr:3'(2'),5'-bisphosphate nucleotidase CysQ [Candidatus Saccharicenans sp.]